MAWKLDPDVIRKAIADAVRITHQGEFENINSIEDRVNKEDTLPLGMNPQDIKPEDMNPKETKTDDTKLEVNNRKEIKTEVTKLEDTQHENIKTGKNKQEKTIPDNVKPTETNPGNIKLEDTNKLKYIKPGQTNPDNDKTVFMKPEYTKPGENTTLDIKTENIKSENNFPKDIKPKETTKTIEESKEYVLDLSGLPWSATDDDILNFFKGCHILDFEIIPNDHGKPSGNAKVWVSSEEDFSRALLCDKKNMGTRYVHVRKADGALENDRELESVNKHKPFNPSSYGVKLSGLEWSLTSQEICQFLGGCDVVGGPKGVTIEMNERGKPSGNAFVNLGTKADLVNALKYNRKMLGRRFVDIKEMTKNDRESIFGKNIEEKKQVQLENTKDRNTSPNSGVFFVKLTGLDWSKICNDIIDFLAGCEVVDGQYGVTMERNEKGDLSGTAFVKLRTKADVERALQYNKKTLGQRFVNITKLTTREEEYIRKKTKWHYLTVKLWGLHSSLTKHNMYHFISGCGIVEIPGKEYLENVIVEMEEGGKQTAFLNVKCTESMLAKTKEKLDDLMIKYEFYPTVSKDGMKERRSSKDQQIQEENTSDHSILPTSCEFTVRLSGLDWSLTSQQICTFLASCNIVGGPDGVTIEMNEREKPSGSALVKLRTTKDVENALKYNQAKLGKRYVHVENVTKEIRDAEEAAAKPKFCVKIINLSRKITVTELSTFLFGSNMKKVEIVLPLNEKGKQTGEAFVKIDDKEDLPVALELNGATMGSRRIEICQVDIEEYSKEKIRDMTYS